MNSVKHPTNICFHCGKGNIKHDHSYTYVKSELGFDIKTMKYVCSECGTEYAVCPECGGSGFIEDEFIDCPICHGNGFMKIEKEFD